MHIIPQNECFEEGQFCL